MLLKINKFVLYISSFLLIFTGISYSQTLTVSLGDNNHAASFEDTDGSDIVMIQIKLSADADIDVTSITVDPTAGGIRRNELVDNEILIYEDKNHNGVLETSIDEFIASDNYSEGASQAPANAVVVSVPNKTILSGTTQDWIILHTFTNADDNDDITVDITNIAVNTGSVTGTPVNGNTRTAETNAASRDGSLFLGEGGANPLARNVNDSASDEVMLQLVLATSTLEAGTITQIDFDMSGTGDESTDLTNAKLYNDGDGNGQLNLEQDTQIGSTVTSFTNNGVLSFTGLSETITAGSGEHWIVVYNYNGSASNDETFILDLTANTDVTASGMAISGAPANGNTATISATGSLTLTLGSNNPAGTSISATESELAMIQINLAASATEDIAVSAIRFNTSGTADESTDIDSVLLFNDGNSNGAYDPLYDNQIGNTITSFTNDSLITFSSLTDTITAGSNENWLLLYYLNGSGTSGETFKTYFDASTQVTATGVTSTNSISPLGLPVNGNNMTISSVGTITLAVSGSNPGDENYNGTAPNMTMLAFTITANDVEDISIDSIVVNAETNDVRKSELEDNDVKIYEDVDANGLLNVAVDRLITSANYSSNGGQYPVDAYIGISGETVAANSSVDWIIVHSITGGSVDDYIEVSVLNTDIFGTGQTSSSAANISGPSMFGGTKTHVTGVPGSLTLAEGAQNPAFRFISGGTQNETMLQFQLTADGIEDIDITQFKIITSGTGNESNDVDSVRLFLDGDNNGSFNIINDTQLGSTVSSLVDNDTLTFSSFNDTISSSSAKNYIVVYNYNTSNNAVGETFKAVIGNSFLTATGITSTSAITPTGGPANGEIVTITDTGTLTVSAGSNNPAASNVTNIDSNVVAIQLNIAAGSNEDVTITAIAFTMSGTFNDANDFRDSSFVLYNDDNGNGALDGGELQLGTGVNPSADNGTITFSGLSETILASSNENWIILTTLGGVDSAANFENFRVSFSNSADITATGDDTGDDIFPAGTPVQGGLKTIGATGSLSLTVGSNNPGASTEVTDAQALEMFQVRLTASGVENIEITSITFTADGTGDDLVDLNDAGNGVTLYLDANNDGIVDGGDVVIGAQSTYSANNGTVTFTITDTINAGTSENWLIAYDLDGTASNGETFRVGIYSATDITASGVTSTDPITPTGFPVVGNFKTIGAAIGSLTLFVGDFNPGVGILTDQLDFEMLQFKLTVSTTENIAIDQLTITHLGTGDPVNDLQNNGVQLIRDINNNGIYDSGTDEIIGNTNYSGTTATFTFADTILADGTQNWLITYDFIIALTDGETYQARIVNLTDISLTGVSSTESITAEGSVPINGGTKTYDADNPLPVELTSFTAVGEYGFVSLNWITQSEINNLGFDLERKLTSETSFKLLVSYTDFDELKGQGTVSHDTEYSFKDVTVLPEKEYIYRLVQYDYGGAVHIQNITPSAIAKMPLPTDYQLLQNYPNPFNPQTRIKFELPDVTQVSLAIYNILGQKVITLKDEILDIGRYSIVWNGQNDVGVNVASGMYFYVLQARNIETKKQYRMLKKMILVR